VDDLLPDEHGVIHCSYPQRLETLAAVASILTTAKQGLYWSSALPALIGGGVLWRRRIRM